MLSICNKHLLSRHALETLEFVLSRHAPRRARRLESCTPSGGNIDSHSSFRRPVSTHPCPSPPPTLVAVWNIVVSYHMTTGPTGIADLMDTHRPKPDRPSPDPNPILLPALSATYVLHCNAKLFTRPRCTQAISFRANASPPQAEPIAQER